MSNYSDFLYARPSFAEGIARILDFGNTLSEYNYSLTPDQADTVALRMDWHTVGNDLRNAMNYCQDELEVQSRDGAK